MCRVGPCRDRTGCATRGCQAGLSVEYYAVSRCGVCPYGARRIPALPHPGTCAAAARLACSCFLSAHLHLHFWDILLQPFHLVFRDNNTVLPSPRHRFSVASPLRPNRDLFWGSRPQDCVPSESRDPPRAPLARAPRHRVRTKIRIHPTSRSHLP